MLQVELESVIKTFPTNRNEKFYRSNSIEYGRLVKKFFYKVTDALFATSYKTYHSYHELYKDDFLPLMANERVKYAHFACAIEKLTPIFMSECPLNKSDAYKIENNRTVDFWCLYNDGEYSKKLNYFIELKKSYYCVSKGTSPEITSHFSNTIQELVIQLREIKFADVNWYGDGNVFLGIITVHGYRNCKKQRDQNSLENMLDSIHNVFDKRTNAQILLNTIEMNHQTESHTQITFPNKDVLEFISFLGIVISKKR